MSWLTELQSRKVIAACLAAGDSTGSEAKQALDRLGRLGPPAIPQIIRALAGDNSSEPLRQRLVGLLTSETLAHYIDGLKSDDPSVVAVAERALLQGHFDPNLLLDQLRYTEVSQEALLRILVSRAKHLRPADVLATAGDVDPRSRRSARRLMQEVATSRWIPTLIDALDSEDPKLQRAVVETLAKFDTPEVTETLLRVLTADGPPDTRLAALQALARANRTPPVGVICDVLQDPDMVLRNQASEILGRLNLPGTVEHLRPMMVDPSVNVRRATVEALHDLGDEEGIPLLVDALGDSDWWVRVRAADALAGIGTARVMGAILPLLGDEEGPRRERVVEIIRRVNSQEVFDFLVESLRHDDARMRAHAASALALLRNDQAIEPLVPLLDERGKSSHHLFGALGELGDARAIPPLIAHLEGTGDVEIKREALLALRKLSEGENAQLVLEALEKIARRQDEPEILEMTLKTVVEIKSIIMGSSTSRGGARPSGPTLREASPHLLEAPLDPLELEEGDLLADRYRVVRKIGQGGFGVVVLAVDEEIHEQVVLKFLSTTAARDREMIARFKRELRFSRRITHQNVIRIFDLLRIGGLYAISMEYFESRSLGTVLQAGLLEQDRILAIVRDICSGLEVAHQVGVIHRDLKPGNVLINAAGNVKIVDFGIAVSSMRALVSTRDHRLTEKGLLVGTPTYMAPEQIEGQELDERTDIYSLGIMFYEMLTGRPPYEAPDPVRVFVQHLAAQPKPPSRLVRMPPALEAIVLKAMAVNPSDRFQSAKELRKAVLGSMGEHL